MTTIIDPGTATETAIFNKGGTAILNAVVDPVTSNYDIPAVAGRVIVLVTKAANTGSGTVTLSSDFEIGDEVWVIGENSSSWGVIDENGNTITTHATGQVCTLMKVKVSTSNIWLVIT
jgi:hypothetical protein